jgi:hypothetical protein
MVLIVSHVSHVVIGLKLVADNATDCVAVCCENFIKKFLRVLRTHMAIARALGGVFFALEPKSQTLHQADSKLTRS